MDLCFRFGFGCYIGLFTTCWWFKVWFWCCVGLIWLLLDRLCGFVMVILFCVLCRFALFAGIITFGVSLCCYVLLIELVFTCIACCLDVVCCDGFLVVIWTGLWIKCLSLCLLI